MISAACCGEVGNVNAVRLLLLQLSSVPVLVQVLAQKLGDMPISNRTVERVPSFMNCSILQCVQHTHTLPSSVVALFQIPPPTHWVHQPTAPDLPAPQQASQRSVESTTVELRSQRRAATPQRNRTNPNIY
eukprot:scpid98043/ scgid28173/ 